MIGDPFVTSVLFQGAAAEPVGDREGDAGKVHTFVSDVFWRVVSALSAADDPGRNLGGDGGRNDPANPTDYRVSVLEQRQQLFNWQLALVELDVCRREWIKRPFLARL
ncbi:TPA: hypothetical protein N2C03_006854 [Pseudomonas aeruginosa]|nr:hypothetical protein [Pseudomonas aeruginosa]